MRIPHQQKTTGQPGLDRDNQVDVQQWVIDKVGQVKRDLERFRDADHAKEWQRRAIEELIRDFKGQREWSTARMAVRKSTQSTQ